MSGLDPLVPTILFLLSVTLPALIGSVFGAVIHRYRPYVLVFALLPPIYLFANILYGYESGGIEQTVVLGIPTGNSPVGLMYLLILSTALWLGVALGTTYPDRITRFVADRAPVSLTQR